MRNDFDSWQFEERKYLRDVAVKRRARRDSNKGEKRRSGYKEPRTRYGAFRAAVRGANYSKYGSAAFPVMLTSKGGCWCCCRERIKPSSRVQMACGQGSEYDLICARGNCQGLRYCTSAWPCSDIEPDSDADSHAECLIAFMSDEIEAGGECSSKTEAEQCGTVDDLPGVITNLARNVSGYAASFANFLGFGSGIVNESSTIGSEVLTVECVEDQDEDWVVVHT